MSRHSPKTLCGHSSDRPGLFLIRYLASHLLSRTCKLLIKDWPALFGAERDGKLKFSLSNAPVDIPKAQLHRAATLRWPIEQCFQECKSYLGMGHCEARSWKAWHRYILFLLIAHLFILEVRQHFKKTGEPVLTMPQARRLIIAALSGDDKTVKKTLKVVKELLRKLRCSAIYSY